MLLVLAMSMAISSCGDTWGTQTTNTKIIFPSHAVLRALPMTQDNERTSYSFPVRHYRYDVSNSQHIHSDRRDSHCSSLFLGGFLDNTVPSTNPKEAWLTLVADTGNADVCYVKTEDFCYKGQNGNVYGMMFVEQSEIDILHDRLLNPDVKGEFVASCTTHTIDAESHSVIAAVRVVGFR